MSFFVQLILSPTVLFISVLCFAIYYLVYLRQVQRWKCANIPFLWPVFLMGHKHFFKLFTNSVVVPLDLIYRENEDKDLVGFFVTLSPVILLKDPRLIKQIYAKSFDKMFENGFFPVDHEVEYQSVVPLSSDRTLWKIGRSAMAPSFSTTRLANLEHGKLKKQVDRLWHHAEKAERLGKPLDGKEAAHNFIVDSVSAYNFTVDINSWEEKTQLYQIVGGLFGLTYQRLLTFFVLTTSPFLQNLNFFRFVRREHIDSVTTFLTQTIEYRDKYNVSHDDFIDHMMSLRGEAHSKEVDTNNADLRTVDEGIGVKEMVGYSLSWLLAGSDTSSQLCLFTVHLLSLHPEYQEKIRNEVDEALKKHNVSEISSQIVLELQFMQNCLLEASRLYPILPALMRCCSEDFRIPGTNYILRKGDRVIITPYSMHRDPRYFKNPDAFYPERFSPENKNFFTTDMYVSFGTGPRRCPGYKIGVSLAGMFIASLLHKYELRPHSHMKQMDATDFDPRGFTTQHTGEFLVDLVPHKNSNS